MHAESEVFTGVTPMLICDDVQASIAFYRDALGFEVADRDDSIGRTGWASLRLGPAHVMLASPTYVTPAPRVGGRHPQSLYYFYTKDVGALRDRLLEKGHEPGPLEDRFYGMREFELIDPSGHVLVFGQDSA